MHIGMSILTLLWQHVRVGLHVISKIQLRGAES